MIWAHLLKGQLTLSYGKIAVQGINDNQYKKLYTSNWLKTSAFSGNTSLKL